MSDLRFLGKSGWLDEGFAIVCEGSFALGRQSPYTRAVVEQARYVHRAAFAGLIASLRGFPQIAQALQRLDHGGWGHGEVPRISRTVS